MNEEITIFTDGGSRGNPGEAAYAFIIFSGHEKIFETGKRIGRSTNNVAEYLAVLNAFKWLKENFMFPQKLSFFSDSQLLVNQLKGLYKIKNENLKEIILEIRQYEKIISKNIFYNLIPREKNKNADLLVNRALDNEI